MTFAAVLIIDPHGRLIENKLFVCLFELMRNVQVNSYGHVGSLPPFYGTCSQNKGRHDIQKIHRLANE